MGELIISMHIPKTGGVSLKVILEHQYKDSFVWLTQTSTPIQAYQRLLQIDRPNLKCVHGHVSYGLHRFFLENYKYIVFLRNPIDRIFSYFNYILTKPVEAEYRWNEKFHWNDSTKFSDWLKDCRVASQDNGITRFLSGSNVLNTNELTGFVTKYDYEIALENLKKMFFVGLLETYNDSVINLSRLLGWTSQTRIPTENRSNYKTSPISKDDIKLIELSQEFDLMLWEEAKKRNGEFLYG